MDFRLTDEQVMVRQMTRTFAERELAPRASDIDHLAEFPRELLPTMAGIGLLGMVIPDEFGGTELDTVSVATALEEIGRVCGSTGLSVAAHTSLGSYPLVRWGTQEQKQRWLPVLAGGKALGSLCLTEPDAGSDLNGIQTRARPAGDEWIINGSKAWITNPSLAQVLIVLVRTGDAFSHILVETDRPGVTIGPPEKKMGVRGSPTHQVSFDSVQVPRTNTLGDEGRGMQQTLEILDGGRIGIGALSVGIAQGALEAALAFARERQAFGRPITAFEAIQWMLADGGTAIEAARLLILQAAWLRDQGLPFKRQAAMAKLYASEMAETVARNAIQILGSYGYSQEYPVERMYRDARLMTIGEGTSEVQRLVIARQLLKQYHGQG